MPLVATKVAALISVKYYQLLKFHIISHCTRTKDMNANHHD